jgi:hypothetical protein
LCGQEREARAILAQIQDQNRFGRVSPWSAAWVHVGLGERDAALKWLAQAVAERDPKIVFLRTKPFWDPLRPDPRFQALLRKMRLTD